MIKVYLLLFGKSVFPSLGLQPFWFAQLYLQVLCLAYAMISHLQCMHKLQLAVQCFVVTLVCPKPCFMQWFLLLSYPNLVKNVVGLVLCICFSKLIITPSVYIPVSLSWFCHMTLRPFAFSHSRSTGGCPRWGWK